MRTLRGKTSGVTVHLTPENREWLRNRAHTERKSQALVLNEVLAEARECQHEKVYSPFVLASHPEQYPWICAKCLAQGVDGGMLQKPRRPRYEDLLAKAKEDGDA